MVRQENLNLISRMRQDAALYPGFEGEYAGSGPHSKYGGKLKARQLAHTNLKKSSMVPL